MEESPSQPRTGDGVRRNPAYQSGGLKRRPYVIRKKECQFCKNRVKVVDYKNYELLRKFMSDRGKMLSSKITGTCYIHQKQLSCAIKWGRFLALLPFTTVKYDS